MLAEPLAPELEATRLVYRKSFRVARENGAH